MMMRTIREKTRFAIVFLAIAFAGWLVFQGVRSRDTAASQGTNPVIANINGEQIRFVEWSNAQERSTDQARQAKGGVLTDEERRQAEQDAWENMIRDVLIRQEIERIGIEVTDAEVQQAFRTSPPPFVLRSPAFQTDGQFDYTKYQAFFSDPSVDEQLLLSIEQYYRDELPRRRLQQELTAGVAVSDAQAWEEFKARNETSTVTYVSIDPDAAVADSEIAIAEADARRYYREHREEYERPATATVRMASFSTVPSAADTARVRARADSIRSAILDGELTFAEAATEFSADSLSAESGGELGRYTPADLREPISSTVAELDAGEISGPVTTPSGIHLIRVSERSGDTATIAHLVLPVHLSEQGEDELFGRMDDLEGIALTDGLLAAGDSLGIEVRENVALNDGFDFVPGAGSLGVGVDWALDEQTEIGELSEFFENGSGYHILELVGRAPGGEYDFEEVRSQIEANLRTERRMAAAREKARLAVDDLQDATIEALTASTGWPEATAGPFGRREFVSGLGRDTEAVGAAFAAPVGSMSGPYAAGDHLVVLRVDRRTEADGQLFGVMKDQVKAQLTQQMAQRRMTQWMEAVRSEATVVDHRDRLNQGSDVAPPPPMF